MVSGRDIPIDCAGFRIPIMYLLIENFQVRQPLMPTSLYVLQYKKRWERGVGETVLKIVFNCSHLH